MRLDDETEGRPAAVAVEDDEQVLDGWQSDVLLEYPACGLATGRSGVQLQLLSNEVQVWRFSIGGCSIESLGSLLDQEEARRASQYRLPEDQLRMALGWAAARHVLGTLLTRQPRDLRFTRECRHCGNPHHGKPRVVDAEGLDFNLSHSGDLVLLVVGQNRLVGVDLERTGTGVQPLELLRWFGPSGNFIRDLPDELAALRLWTAAEARLKMIGLGLAGFPRTLACCPPCTTATLPIDSKHVGAVAASGTGCRLRLISGDRLFSSRMRWSHEIN